MKKEREKGILRYKDWAEVYHRDAYKTAIVYFKKYDPNNEYLVYDKIWNQYIDTLYYKVVTKQTYITSRLWLEWRNKQVNDGRKGFVKLPDKVNWLVMVRSFRRKQERQIKVLQYLEYRKKREEKK